MSRLLLAAGLLLAASGVAGADELRTLATRPGVTQPFSLVRPAAAPRASVILFAGGNGALHLDADGRPAALGGNFLVRNRARFAAHGLLVAVLDAPSDHAGSLERFRTSAEHAADVRAVIAALRETAPVPVWLVGTSMGTVSAANAAARLREGGPDGLVLSSTVTRGSRQRGESVEDVRVKDIRIPTLLVHHRGDACPITRYGDAVHLLDDLGKTPRHELLTFEGGSPPQSPPCEARAAHGYLGLDEQVVTAIADWIVATPRR
jgi:dienelactone hydrolase